MILDGSGVNFFIAFLAGLAAFFSPCVAPIIPAYLGYFGGAAAASAAGEHPRLLRWKPFGTGVSFVAGFLIVFLLLGFSASGIGRFFIRHRASIERFGGVLLIFLGLFLLDVFKSPWLYRQFQIDLHGKVARHSYLSAFLVGLTFGFSWTPCIGPVLAVILFFASQADTVATGVFLLFFFGIGLALPFLVMSLMLGSAARWLRRSGQTLRIVQMISGVVVIIIGILMVTGRFNPLLGFFIRISNPAL